MNEKSLTADQLRAVLTVDRPLCIRAGAGSGKTSVLAYHYAALVLMGGLKPSETVAVTFTEKAAGELKSRIQEVLQEGVKGQLPFQERIALRPFEIERLLKEIPQAPISTLHSLAARIVREASLLTGFDPHFEVLDANQAHALKVEALAEALSQFLAVDSPPLKLLVRGYGFGALKRQLVNMLEDWPRWKAPVGATGRVAQGDPPDRPYAGEKAGPPETEKEIEEALNEVFASVLNRYEALKLKRQSLDFDDLEEEALKLLRNHPWVTRHYRGLWRAYLVDEFQDVSLKQDQLISALLEIDSGGRLPDDRHLAVVGDEKQSIYSFRGAEPFIFEKFQERIEKSAGLTVTLSKNFRSPPLILRWVNTHFHQVFKHYPPLEAHGEDPPGASLEVLQAPLLEEGQKLKAEKRRSLEAKALAKRVARLLNEGAKPSEIFFLFRNMTYVPIYRKALQELKIPVYLKMSESLLDRQEVLDLIHALRAVVEPANPLSWVGLLRSPALGVSDEALLRHAFIEKGKPFSEMHPFFRYLKNRDPREGPYEFLKEFLEETELVSLYASHESLSGKAQNLLQFLHGAHEWEAHEGGGLADFLKGIDLLSRNQIPWEALSDRLGTGEAVTLMTVHQAKGLDFPVVILPDLGAGGQPDSIPIAERFEGKTGLRLPIESAGLKAQAEDSEALKDIKGRKGVLAAQEEDRVFYVAATRAKQKMILGFLPQNGDDSRLAFSRLALSLGKTPGITWLGEESSAEAVLPDLGEIQTSRLKPLPKAKLNQFAVTELECFLKSKEDYLSRYVHRLPPEPLPAFASAKDVAASSLDPLKRGVLAHEALCLMTQKGKNFSPREALNLAWERRFELQENSADFEALAQSLEKTFGHPSFQPILQAEEAYSEIPFLLSLSAYRIRGAMDRLLRLKEDWVVLDYKTHRSPEESTFEDFEFQMKTYCLAAGRMLGKEVKEARLYFIEPNTIHPFSFSTGELKAHETSLLSLMDEINEWRGNLE